MNSLFGQKFSTMHDLDQQQTNIIDIDAGTTLNIDQILVEEETQDELVPSVALIQFAGRELKRGIELTWDVDKQGQNMYYTVERSNGFSPWKTIRDIISEADKKHYILVDPLPDVGLNHYRLSQTDEDGAHQFLSLTSINYQNTDHISVAAFDGYLTIQSFESMELHEISVYDLRGQEHYMDLVYMGKGDQIQINLNHLPKGIYIAKVEYPLGYYSKKIILAEEKEIGVLF
jgi:hypothetical protein